MEFNSHVLKEHNMKSPFSLCPFCDTSINETDFLCPDCRAKIETYNKLHKCAICGQPRTTEPVCTACKEKKPAFTLVCSCYHYDGIFREALLAYKLGHQFHKAKGFSLLLLEKFKKLGLEIDCITAVPVGPSTYWKYDYNAPLEMLYAMNRKLKLPCYTGLLRKRWFAKRQSSLTGSKRLQNVKGNFRVANRFRDKIKGKRILVIDDVYTTGSTANECARILKKEGAKEVYFLTLLGNASR